MRIIAGKTLRFMDWGVIEVKMSLAVDIDFDLTRIQDYVEEEVDSFRSEVTHAVFERVRELTAVKTGYARLNWEEDRGQGVIWNAVAYILKLENGHSKQAPTGMVKNALLELDSGILLRNYRADVAGIR